MADAIVQYKTRVLDIDLTAYYDNIRPDVVLAKVAKRIDDYDVLHVLKLLLKTTGTQGVAQGDVSAPLLSNLYLTEVDRMLERAKAVTRRRKLKAIFRRLQSQPMDRGIDLLNPILRGWVTYFAIGDAGRCFGYVQDWVKKKMRRHVIRARKRKGFGWKRWSRRWLYDSLGVFGRYRVHRPKQLRLKALPV